MPSCCQRSLNCIQEKLSKSAAHLNALAEKNERMAEELLGRHHDERLAEGADDLPTERVEEVARRRHVDNLPIRRADLRLPVGHLALVVVAQLQEALEPRGGVLWPRALVAVR